MSYGQIWKAEQECTIATIPFGYYEGWMRNMAGKLNYTWNGISCQQIGKICMNMSSCLGKMSMKK